MYVFTREGLGEAPMLSGSIAGMLGEDVFPTEVRELLNKIGNRPRDYKHFLMLSELDPDFWLSTYFPKGYDVGKLQELLILTDTYDRFLYELQQITADLAMRDHIFGRQYNVEVKLQVDITHATKKLGEQKLKPFLQVLLAKRLYGGKDLRKFSLDIAQRMLPKTLVQQITSSQFFSEAHLNMLGGILLTYMGMLKERQQAEQKLKTKPQRQRRK